MEQNYFSRGLIVYAFIFLFFSFSGFAQVGIGTVDPNPNAKLDISSTLEEPGGLLLPRVALLATNNSSPLTGTIENGMIVYNTATAGSGATRVTPGFYYHDGAQWVRIIGSTAPKDSWQLAGNSGTNITDNFLGTTDSQPLRIRTNGNFRFEFTTNGRLRSENGGSAAEPTYSWAGVNAQTMGMFRPAADVLGFSTASTERFRIPNADQVHAMNNGSASYPFYSWASNSRMGMFAAGANILAFSTNTGERMRILANGQLTVNRTTAINGTTRLTVGETGANRAIYGNSASGEGVRGEATTGKGVVGIVTSGEGVQGQATSGSGVVGLATLANAKGGNFANSQNNGFGLWALGGGSSYLNFPNSGTGAAITGRLYGTTSMAIATNGLGLAGSGDNLGGIPAARPLGVGVLGFGYQAGVFGDSGFYGMNGVHGSAEGNPAGTSFGTGVYGENVNNLGDGVYGESSNVGVRGYGANGAILESSNGGGYGAVAWHTASSGDRVGLLAIGQNLGPVSFPGTGAILYGLQSGGSGWANNINGTGLIGAGNSIGLASLAENGSGVAGTGSTVGVYGKANQTTDGIGVIGVGNNLVTYVVPSGVQGAGVAGTGTNIGVFGHATDANGYGVYSSGNMYVQGTITVTSPITAPRGIITDGFIVSEGNMGIDGSFTAQSISTVGDVIAGGVKNFIIDDPRDPANKFLKHASIESDEILNLYRGMATFDTSGQAIVQLPDYYDAINKNASYQLTPVGASMPNLYIAEEVNNGTFVIAGGLSGKKVSWIITAERNDPYIRDNPESRNMVVDKGAERGLYLAPESYGHSADRGILNNRISEMRTASRAAEPNQTIVTQEMQSRTSEAKILNREEVEKLTTPFEGRRASTLGSKEMRDVQITKADEVKVKDKILEQEGQTTTSSPASENESSSKKTLHTDK